MRRLWWVTVGVVIGFVAAHLVNRTPEGKALFERVNRGVDEFGKAFHDGYVDEEAQAAGLADEVEAALRRLENQR